ncbi:MAG: tetratricopeptide repeat protein [Rhodospirillales bacterium]
MVSAMRLLRTLYGVLPALPAVLLLNAAPASAGPTGWCTDHSGRNFRCGAAPTPQPAPTPRYAPNKSPSGSPRTQADKYYNYGNASFRAKRYADAVAHYRRAHTLNPKSADIKDALGRALSKVAWDAYQRKDHLSAVLYYEQAAKLYSPRMKKRKRTALDNIRKIKNINIFGTTRSCVTCAKALMSDLDYGLSKSQAFRSYAKEATDNFGNCTRTLKNACIVDRGGRLYSNVRKCDRGQKNDKSHKACVRTVLRGAKYAPK